MDIEHLTNSADRYRLVALTCTICLCLLDDPVQCPEGHLFCHKCLLKWMSTPGTRSSFCPTCSIPLPQPDAFIKNRALQNLLGPCPCRCPNCPNWTGTVQELYNGHYDIDGVTCPTCLQTFTDVKCTGELPLEHLCPNEMLTCKQAKPRLAVSYVANGSYYTHAHTKIGVAPNGSDRQVTDLGFFQGHCGITGPRKDGHVCPYAMLPCSSDKCTWTGLRSERPSHIDHCPFLWPLCPVWGCNERYAEGQELQHRKDFHKWSLEADADAWDDLLRAQEVVHARTSEKVMRWLMNQHSPCPHRVVMNGTL